MSETKLTHLAEDGSASMVDVGDKAETVREAIAEGTITMKAETLELIRQGDMKKGDVIGVARIAGIMAAKQTSNLIPLCHPLMLTKIAVDIEEDASLPGLRVQSTVRHRSNASGILRRSGPKPGAGAHDGLYHRPGAIGQGLEP